MTDISRIKKRSTNTEYNIKDASAFRTGDTADTTIDNADTIPFYDTSAMAKKKITLDDFVTAIGGSGGSNVTVSHTGTASATGVRKQIITVNNVPYDIDGTAYMEQQVTLSTSVDTVVTFTNAAINLTSEITVGTSKYGICPIDVDAETAGVCEVTFGKVDTAVTITVRICLR